jgi:hypothetical protein
VGRHLSKLEVLEHYLVVDTLSHKGLWELLFLEGGHRVTVFEYSSWQEAQSFWEDDSLMHWSRSLGRTWEDE